MTTETRPRAEPGPGRDRSYTLTAQEITARFKVDPAAGLSGQQAAELLVQNGPNAPPAEQAVPEWQRFVQQYRSYMQLILLGAAIVSLVIKEWSTGVLLIVIRVAATGWASAEPSGKVPIKANGFPGIR